MITFFPSRCYNGGQQHRFEARVTEKVQPPHVESMRGYNGPAGGAVRMLEAGTARTITYHGDVCVWCGKTVNNAGGKV